MIVHFTEPQRCGSVFAFKEPDKMCGVGNSDRFSDFADRPIRGAEQIGRYVDASVVEILQRRDPVAYRKFPAQAVFADAKLLCQTV